MSTLPADLLSADLDMGTVTLNVADLDAMTAYYRDGVLLDVLSHSGDRTVLGRRGTPILALQHAPELKHASPSAAGLYHTAVLFDSQADLSASVYSVATKYPHTFTGSADHLVSQAFYATDPEGNGVELYWDRDRSLWSWKHGQVEMASLRLDPNGFIREHITEAGASGSLADGAKVGHVHLSVGDVRTAREFYVDQLGFAATADIAGSALFVSAGGYHHHMAMNVWGSRGAGLRAPALGLAEIKISLPSLDDIGQATERMRHYGVSSRDDGRAVTLDDPWGNRIELSTPAHTG